MPNITLTNNDTGETFNFDLRLVRPIVQKTGRSETLACDPGEIVSPAGWAYAIGYGIKQSVQDAGASAGTRTEALGLQEKRWEAIKAGTVNERDDGVAKLAKKLAQASWDKLVKDKEASRWASFDAFVADRGALFESAARKKLEADRAAEAALIAAIVNDES